MAFERLRKIADAKLAKLGLNIDYKLHYLKKGESGTNASKYTIYINPRDRSSKWLAVQSLQHLLLHEIGHIIAYDHLIRGKRLSRKPEVRDLFGDISKFYRRNLHIKRHNPDFISTYAQVHPREDFCETFAVYANLGGDIRKIKAFLKKRGTGPKVLKKMLWINGIVKNIANI